jgi:myo-inositol-hexaphosphate 3-phosphohydrolase
MRYVSLAAFLLLTTCDNPELPVWQLVQAGATEQAADDPDDPAIWIHPVDPERSLILGTNKVERPDGALLVFDMQGKTIQKIGGLGRPNNVDVLQDAHLGGQSVDLTVLTERQASALRIYTVDAQTRMLAEAVRAQYKIPSATHGGFFLGSALILSMLFLPFLTDPVRPSVPS